MDPKGRKLGDWWKMKIPFLKRAVVLSVILFLAGCMEPGKYHKIEDFILYLNHQKMNVSDVFDFSSDTKMQSVVQQKGGRVFSAKIAALTFDIVERPSAPSARLLMIQEDKFLKAAPASEKDKLPLVLQKDNLVLYIRGSMKNGPEAGKLIEAFKNLN